MAYVEIPEPEYIRKSFVKFENVDDRLEGYYLSDEPGNFNKQDFAFRKADGTLHVVSANKVLQKQLVRPDGSALVEGDKVLIVVSRLKKVDGFDKPVKHFRVAVDVAPRQKMPPAATDDAAPAAAAEEDPFA